MNALRRQRVRLGSAIVVVVLCCLVAAIAVGDRADAAAPSERVAAAPTLAGDLLGRIGVRRGLYVVLGGESALPLQLATKADGLLVHARNPQPGVVEELRKQAGAAGLGIDRLAVELGTISRLPHADNIVDAVIAPAMTPASLEKLSAGEVLRALRPHGTAIVGVAAGNATTLQKWAGNAGGKNVRSWTGNGMAWVQFSKPEPKGSGEWSHWEHGPDNNPVSEDTIIKAPYMTQFMAKPYYIAMPSITTAAGGRTFLAIGHIAHHRREWGGMNKLIARNGYNGTLLWERKLPEGYLVHRSAFIATKDTFHMIDGNRCLLLDPETGREQGEIRIPGVTGQWKWMVIKDDVLFVLAGKPDPHVQTTKGDRSFGG